MVIAVRDVDNNADLPPVVSLWRRAAPKAKQFRAGAGVVNARLCMVFEYVAVNKVYNEKLVDLPREDAKGTPDVLRDPLDLKRNNLIRGVAHYGLQYYRAVNKPNDVVAISDRL